MGDPAAPRALPRGQPPGAANIRTNSPAGRRLGGHCAGAISPWSPGTPRSGCACPLTSLTWQPEPPEEPEVSPFDELHALSVGKAARRRRKVKEVKPEEVPRGALCVEHRQGKVFVFLPPVQRLEQFVDLVGVVQEAATKLRQPVVFEGYLPPFDPRLVRLLVTPDPGRPRGQHPSGLFVAGAGGHHHRRPRRRAGHPARD